MSKKSATNDQISEAAYELMVAEEELILEVQMAIQRELNERGMSQKALAEKLGVGESYVSQMLGDSARNLTLRTVARVLKALGTKAVITLDEEVAEIGDQLITELRETDPDASAVAAVASKVASTRLTDAWDCMVIDIASSKKSSRRKVGCARAYGAYDPPVEEVAMAA